MKDWLHKMENVNVVLVNGLVGFIAIDSIDFDVDNVVVGEKYNVHLEDGSEVFGEVKEIQAQLEGSVR